MIPIGEHLVLIKGSCEVMRNYRFGMPLRGVVRIAQAVKLGIRLLGVPTIVDSVVFVHDSDSVVDLIGEGSIPLATGTFGMQGLSDLHNACHNGLLGTGYSVGHGWGAQVKYFEYAREHFVRLKVTTGTLYSGRKYQNLTWSPCQHQIVNGKAWNCEAA